MTKNQIQGGFIEGEKERKEKKGMQNMLGWLTDLNGRDRHRETN